MACNRGYEQTGFELSQFSAQASSRLAEGGNQRSEPGLGEGRLCTDSVGDVTPGGGGSPAGDEGDGFCQRLAGRIAVIRTVSFSKPAIREVRPGELDLPVGEIRPDRP